VPWRLLLSALLGLWLMLAPGIFRTAGAAADSDHLVGALVVTTAAVAMAEVVRSARFLNVLFGLWVLVGPWLLSGGSGPARGNDLVAGAALILLSRSRGKVRERYGSWDRRIV
jgi:hypothetical protein